MGGIFISYRREDADAWAGRIYERLTQDFRRDEIFMDVDNIAPGLDFVEELARQVGQSDTLLAIIGKDWLNVRNSEGVRRLDEPHDFVRIEVETALQRGVRIIPVLVGGTKMPTAAELPEPLQKLARRNAVELTHARFGSDVQPLIEALKPKAAQPITTPVRIDLPKPAPPVAKSSSPSETRAGLYLAITAGLGLLLVFGWFFYSQRSTQVAVVEQRKAAPPTPQQLGQSVQIEFRRLYNWIVRGEKSTDEVMYGELAKMLRWSNGEGLPVRRYTVSKSTGLGRVKNTGDVSGPDKGQLLVLSDTLEGHSTLSWLFDRNGRIVRVFEIELDGKIKEITESSEYDPLGYDVWKHLIKQIPAHVGPD